ncbi:MAG: hydantoinase B/oxoprolinase family protein [Acidobacteria bacterium]|nr:hydantoinase B/oxoprolinase family protein [Acidobacteriota bacterium]
MKAPDLEPVSSKTKIDPVTLEVLSHRLWQINDEMGITLTKVSGSPVCTESKDFNTGLFLPDGSLVIVGAYVTHFVATLPFIIRSTLESCSRGAGIFEDDMFIINDPYLGAVHPSDVAIVSPVYYQGEIFAWTGTAMHVLDIGAVGLGGMHPRITEVFGEGLRFPPTRIVEQGRLRQDIFDLFLNNVRVPPLVGLDLKAQIAGNNVAKSRILDLIERYGADTVKGVMQAMIDHSEEKMRRRLGELPDGVWTHTDYHDHDGLEDKVYKIVCTMTKSQDALTFDFTGTDREGPGLINANFASTWAGLQASVCSLLCYDILWNQGILKPIQVIAPEGTVVNCSFPAPCGFSSIGTSFAVTNVATINISKMLGTSPKHRQEAMAGWAGSYPAIVFAGLNQYHHFFVAYVMDPTSGSGGARSYKDGVDTGGLLQTPFPSVHNVETFESTYPVLYLFRRELCDSGGPGKYRGGVSVEIMFTLHDAEAVKAVVAGMGAEACQTSGIFGGQPGSSIRYLLVRASNVGEMLKQSEFAGSVGALEGRLEVLAPKVADLLIGNGDVLYLNTPGGGGYGDPLERDPLLVRHDVEQGYVGMSTAERIYGVVIDPENGEVLWDETEHRRARIRAERLQMKRVL